MKITKEPKTSCLLKLDLSSIYPKRHKLDKSETELAKFIIRSELERRIIIENAFALKRAFCDSLTSA